MVHHCFHKQSRHWFSWWLVGLAPGHCFQTTHRYSQLEPTPRCQWNGIQNRDIRRQQTNYTPDPPKVEWVYTGFTPMSDRLSGRPSVCRKVSGTFWKKKIGSIHFIPGIYPNGVVSLLTQFRVPSLIFGPLVAKYLAEMGFPELFEKLLAQFISYLSFTVMGWVFWPLYIFVFLAWFSAFRWPNIRPKMGFPELWKKILAQYISYLAFTLMVWFSWPLYVFVFLASFSAIWWPNIWQKMGFPELFEKKTYWLNSFHTWHLFLWGESLDP